MTILRLCFLAALPILASTTVARADHTMLCRNLTNVQEHVVQHQPELVVSVKVKFIKATTGLNANTLYVAAGGCTWIDRGLHASEPDTLLINSRDFPRWVRTTVNTDRTTTVKSGLSELLASELFAVSVSATPAGFKVSRVLKLQKNRTCIAPGASERLGQASTTWSTCIKSCIEEPSGKCKSFNFDGPAPGTTSLVGTCTTMTTVADKHCSASSSTRLTIGVHPTPFNYVVPQPF